MSTEYDSVKIRRLAAQMARTVTALNNVKQTSLRSINQEMTGNFQGEAANALEQSVADLMDDVTALSSWIDGISHALYALAAQVDEADARIKALIDS